MSFCFFVNKNEKRILSLLWYILNKNILEFHLSIILLNIGGISLKRNFSVNLGNLLLSLSEMIDGANPNLSQHQIRTAFIALNIAQEADLEVSLIEDIFAASILHDIGAISIEEKLAVHKFEVDNTELHCIRGELLLKEVPSLKRIANMVRNHHKKWKDWEENINNPLVISSQIICLADNVERLIDKNKYILNQDKKILQKITLLKGLTFNEDILEYFLKIAKKESFWLDLMSSRLYSILLHNGPYKNKTIGLNELSSIGKLFRHMIDFKSHFTATHTAGVSACSEMMAKLFGLTELEVNMIKIAGNFHDLGKLMIPNSILEKPGKLSEEEFNIIKSHTYYTYQVLNSISGLGRIIEWAAYHHEQLNGNGYPFRLDCNELDIGSRIMAVSDIFVALREDRPYRKSMDKEKVYNFLKKKAENNCVDIEIVDLLFENYDIIDAHVKSKQNKAEIFYEERFLKLEAHSK